MSSFLDDTSLKSDINKLLVSVQAPYIKSLGFSKNCASISLFRGTSEASPARKQIKEPLTIQGSIS